MCLQLCPKERDRSLVVVALLRPGGDWTLEQLGLLDLRGLLQEILPKPLLGFPSVAKPRKLIRLLPTTTRLTLMRRMSFCLMDIAKGSLINQRERDIVQFERLESSFAMAEHVRYSHYDALRGRVIQTNVWNKPNSTGSESAAWIRTFKVSQPWRW